MQTHMTAKVARMTGIHPNTVRLYEQLGLIPQARRRENGYRAFTDFHVEQIRLARTAFQIEVLQNGLRKQVVAIVKTMAKGETDTALELARRYLLNIRLERAHARETIQMVKELFADAPSPGGPPLRRKEAAEALRISMDTLRNWEMNGLLTVKRSQNGYRIYTQEDIRRLKIIRSLRCANYSLEAILRMLSAHARDAGTNLERALNTPEGEADMISVCDRLISSLQNAERNARKMLCQIESMRDLARLHFTTNP